MSTESPIRYQLALDSLRDDITMLEMAVSLVRACEEAIEEGQDVQSDTAVAILSGRIGFASPTDTMSTETWNKLVRMCEQGHAATLELKAGAVQ